MTSDLFDRRLRILRRDRAARMGAELFLYDRAFDDCVERLGDVQRRFGRCLLVGSPSPDWPRRLSAFVGEVDVFDPGTLFAGAAGGQQLEEDRRDFGVERYDLALAIGTLDSVNDVPLALKSIHRALRRDSPLIGAIAGGHSLPMLRKSLIEAGRATGRVVARTHPRIEASSLAALLSAAGFAMPVVDVDRVSLRYPSLSALVRDLRAMGMSSALADRPPALTRDELRIAAKAFDEQGRDGRTEEQIEILHFIGWRQ